MTAPQFRKQTSIWSLSDGCFVVPHFTGVNADLVAGTVTQLTSTLGPAAEVVQIVASAKFIASGGANITQCPDGAVAGGGDDPAGKCPRQPPYDEKLTASMTVVSSAGNSLLVQRTNLATAMIAVTTAPADSCFWVLTAADDTIYTIEFPPPLAPPGGFPGPL